MTYTITQAEIKKLHAARKFQATAARAQYFKQYGENLPPSAAPACAEFANVEFQNGTLEKFALPVGKLAQWAGFLTPEMKPYLLPEDNEGRRAWTCKPAEITLELNAGKLRAVCGGSEIALCVFPESVPSNQLHHPASREVDCPRGEIGEPIRLVAPAHGGAVVCEFDETKQADFSALKKQVASASKDLKARKAYATAKQAERAALDNLTKAAKLHCENLATCGAETGAGGLVFSLPVWDAALTLARQTRQARAMLRRALATPESVPEWLPESYAVETRREVIRRNADGSPMIEECFQDAFNREFAGTGLLSYDENTPGVRSYWLATDTVTDIHQASYRAEHAALVAALHAARKAAADYTPRKLVSEARATSHRARRRGIKPMLKQDHLAKAVADAESKLRTFFYPAWRQACGAAGLPTDAPWFGDYSRARIAVRAWAGRKAELAARYIAAKQNTAHAAGKLTGAF